MGCKNVKVIRGDVESFGGSGLSDNSVDRVVIANTLFCCDYPDRVVREAVRILKKKGKIAVVDWSDSFGHLGPHPDCLVKKDSIEVWLSRENMILEKEIDTGDFHYGLVFKFKD